MNGRCGFWILDKPGWGDYNNIYNKNLRRIVFADIISIEGLQNLSPTEI